MEDLDITVARVNLTSVMHSLHMRYCTVKEKQPKRTDLLDDLRALRDITQDAYNIFLTLETEYKAVRQLSYDLKNQNMQLRYQLDQANKKIENLMNGL